MIKRILNLVSSFIFKRKPSVIFQIGSSHFALMREKYSKIKDLNELDYKVYSQAGEDGIIDYLLYLRKFLIEILRYCLFIFCKILPG